MPTTIYALCEPDLQIPVIRYIGKTTDLVRRFLAHKSQSVRKKNHLGCWLRSLTARGETSVLMPLTEVSDDLGSSAEILYIRLAREGGIDLVNGTDGGEGVPQTPEIRGKISAAQRGKRHSKETREKIGNSQRGQTRSRETKALQSKARKGFSSRYSCSLSKLPNFSGGGGI